MTALNLKYFYIDSGAVYLHSSGDEEILSSRYIKQIITAEFKKNIEKYKTEAIKSVVILDKENNTVLNIDI